MDADGYIKITGRIKDIIIKGGENIHPLEVENCLFGHPSIAEASVVGLPDERYGETVAAFIIPHKGAAITATEARSWVREKLSHHLGKLLIMVLLISFNALLIMPSTKVRLLGRQLSKDRKWQDTEIQAEGARHPARQRRKGIRAMTSTMKETPAALKQPCDYSNLDGVIQARPSYKSLNLQSPTMSFKTVMLTCQVAAAFRHCETTTKPPGRLRTVHGRYRTPRLSFPLATVMVLQRSGSNNAK